MDKWKVGAGPTSGDPWLSREQVARICPSCADKMAKRGLRHVRASVMIEAAWESLPKGWTEDSVKSFWEKLTGDRKHKVTACIKKMEGKGGISDAGAFCASLADKFEPGWRSDRSANRSKTAADWKV